MALVVRKYGGMTLESPEKVKAVAQSIFESHQKGNQLIIIVSAMGRTTDLLEQLAKQVSSQPNRREFDMLLSTGERVSAALLSIALNELGCPAISFTGSQAGIMTDQSHTDAEIKEVKPIRIQPELDKGRVVVLAGFQGVCPETKEITTLGRGGSDTTAIAMADHFKADRCEILKDVDGVYSADPNRFTQAKPIPQIDYEALFDMTYYGGGFLHFRSARLAREKKTPLVIDSAHGNKRGTIVSCEKSKALLKPLSINVLKNVIAVESENFNLEAVNDSLLRKNLNKIRVVYQLNGEKVTLINYLNDTGKDDLECEIKDHNLNLIAVTFTSEPNVEICQAINKSLIENGLLSTFQYVDNYSFVLAFPTEKAEQVMQVIHRSHIETELSL